MPRFPLRTRASAATTLFARRATLRRSVRLLGAFRFEQSDPDSFYVPLARDSAEMIDDLHRGATGRGLDGHTIVDVGGGPGYFADAFREAGARYVPVEPDPSEMHARDIDLTGVAIRGSGTALPIRDGAVDVCFSSNVAEHVAQPWQMADEMLRVTKPGGIVVLSYTLWWGPFGGHETGMWHYVLGGEGAARRYRRRHGHEPKNRFGASLFAVHCRDGLAWARSAPSGELLAAFPRYHPRWAWPLVRVPLLREVLVSNLVLVLRKV
ncbi:class I SAM-dependent methyltransferase [Tomitella gaofuii]|uniref:class I SAM-dependent methyltransferase n=1 Tax=Tomitella gaofuii TaxID=2760083 RepID=UPI002E2A9A8B|nr:class I SAM-dependent methyltransferase [Tomitella gaofuii]